MCTNHPAIRGVMFQPIAYTGRFAQSNAMDRITLPDILEGLEAQTKGLLFKSDFVPVPCPHPTCSAVTYIYTDDEQVTPITCIIEVDDYLDYF